MIVSLIVAMDKNRLIGNKNKLPWKNSADLKYFKSMTVGKAVIMGRKTFESLNLPDGLSDRLNIVISTNANNMESTKNVRYYSSLLDCLVDLNIKKISEAVVIGGAKIYKEAIEKNVVDKMYISYITGDYTGDTYFPDLNENDWCETNRTKLENVDYVTYNRISHVDEIGIKETIYKNATSNVDDIDELERYMNGMEYNDTADNYISDNENYTNIVPILNKIITYSKEYVDTNDNTHGDTVDSVCSDTDDDVKNLYENTVSLCTILIKNIEDLQYLINQSVLCGKEFRYIDGILEQHKDMIDHHTKQLNNITNEKLYDYIDTTVVNNLSNINTGIAENTDSIKNILNNCGFLGIDIKKIKSKQTGFIALTIINIILYVSLLLMFLL